MKQSRYFATLLLMASSFFLSAQSIQRNVVVLEIGTGTWCQYCPGAANAADQLVAEGKSVAVIENHNGDPYANTYSNTRNSYYGISGYPTGKFDGMLTYEGGLPCPTGNVYSDYLSLYEQRSVIPSPLNLCFSGMHTGNTYTINVSVDKLGTISATDLRLHLVLTESDIAVNWQGCMNDVNFVNRLMVPSASGTSFSFSSGDNYSTTLTFDADPGWVSGNCELVAFVQNNSTKEIYNGVKSPLNSLPATLFSLNDFTGTPTNGCIPMQVNFSTTQLPSAQLSWDFEGGSPSTSTTTNPSVSYLQTGSFHVILTGTDGVCLDQVSKANYITANGLPGTPGQAQGNANMCINPLNSTYTTSPVASADSYQWELDPLAAGTLVSSGTSCTIDWDNSWTGIAHLKVQAISTNCGPGAWSPPLNINISLPPGQCTPPAGLTTLCQAGPSNDYSTTISTPATTYYWDLQPSGAGYAYQGAQTTTIEWSANFSGPATLKVNAMNGLCEGPFSDPISINVQALPSAYNVSGGGAYCGTGGTGSVVGIDGSQAGLSYTLFVNNTATGTPVTGTGGPISFGDQMAAGYYTVKADDAGTGCSGFMNGGATVSIDPQAPQKPADPEGPGHIYTSTTATADYSTTGGNYATTYTWELSPADAGSIVGNAMTGTANWNPLFVGTANVKVQGVNSCGGGTFSNDFPVLVEMNVGLPELAESTYAAAPIPAHNFVNITGPADSKTEISILNSLGSKEVETTSTFANGLTRIDIQQLSAGVHFIELKSRNTVQVIRLVVE